MARQTNKADKERALMIGKRIALSHEKRQPKITEGEAYEPYIRGEPPTVKPTGNEDAWDRALRKVKQQEKSFGRNWRMTMIPVHGELRRLLLPALAGQDGTWENPAPPTPPNIDDEELRRKIEVRWKRARLYERIAQVIQREYKIHDQLRVAADEAMQFGLTWFKTYRHERKDLIGFKWVSCKRVLYDHECTDDPFGEDQRWKAMCYIVPEEDAKLLAEQWGNKNYEFKSASNEISSDEREGSHKVSELPTKFVKIVIVHVSGNSPHLANADMGTGPNSKFEDVGKDDVYDGKDHRLLMEVQGEWGDWQKYELIARGKAEHITDIGDSVFTPLTLDPDSQEFWGKPIYQAGHSLAVAVNWALRYYNTDLWLSAKRAIGVLDGALDPDEEQALVNDPGNLNIIHFRSRQDMELSIKDIRFGEPNPKLIEGVGMNQGQYGMITGKDVFDGEGKSHETATRAALSSERSQLVIGSMSTQIETAVVTAMRKALMACRQHLDAEQIAKWVGDEYMAWEPHGEDKDGNPIRKSPLWNDEVNDPESIRREVEIALRPRSLRFSSPEQKLNDMDRFANQMHSWVGSLIEANKVNPQIAPEIARIANVFMREYGDLLNLNRAEEMQTDLRAFAARPPDQQEQAQQAAQAQEQERQRAMMEAMSAGAKAGGDAGQAAVGPVAEMAAVKQQLELENAFPGELGESVARYEGQQ